MSVWHVHANVMNGRCDLEAFGFEENEIALVAGAAFGDSALTVFASVKAWRADRKQNVANAYSKEYQL